MLHPNISPEMTTIFFRILKKPLTIFPDGGFLNLASLNFHDISLQGVYPFLTFTALTKEFWQGRVEERTATSQVCSQYSGLKCSR